MSERNLTDATELGNTFMLLIFMQEHLLKYSMVGAIPREDVGTHLNHLFACLKATRGQIT